MINFVTWIGSVVGILLALGGGFLIATRSAFVTGVDPVAVADVGVTILMAVFVANVIDRRRTEASLDRDLILAEVQEVRRRLLDVVATFDEACRDLTDQAKLQQLRTLLKLVGTSLAALKDICKIMRATLPDFYKFPTIVDDFLVLRAAATASLPKEPTVQERAAVLARVEALRARLLRVAVGVNRHH